MVNLHSNNISVSFIPIMPNYFVLAKMMYLFSSKYNGELIIRTGSNNVVVKR